MSYVLDDDASQVRDLKDKLETLQALVLANQFSVQRENVESGQSIFPGANPSARGGGSGIGAGGGMLPLGTTENDHLEWDNSTLLWNAVQSLTFGSTGPFASSGFNRFANDTIMMSARNAADDGNLELKVDSTDFFDFTESNNGQVTLQVRAQHATNPDNTLTITQFSGTTGIGQFFAPNQMQFLASGSTPAFNYDQNRIETNLNILPDGDGTRNIGSVTSLRFGDVIATSFKFDINRHLDFNTGGASLTVNGASDTFTITVDSVLKQTMSANLTTLAGNVDILGVAGIGDKAEFTRITAPVGDPVSSGWMYGKLVSGHTEPFWEDENGTVTNLLASSNVPDGSAIRDHLEWNGSAWIAQQNISFDNNSPSLQFRDFADSSFITLQSTTGNNLRIERGDLMGTGLELSSDSLTTPELFTMRQLNTGTGDMILNTTSGIMRFEVASGGSHVFKNGVNTMATLSSTNLTFVDGHQTIFNPDTTNAGVNIGLAVGDPSATNNGDLWYNSTTNKFRTKENGVNVDVVGGVGSGPPFDDNQVLIQDEVDNTKTLTFNLTLNSTGDANLISSATTASRTWTLPDVTGTIITDTGSQTFTANKTFEHSHLLLEDSDQSNTAVLVPTNLTADRTYTFPDKTGIVAFLDDLSGFAEPLVFTITPLSTATLPTKTNIDASISNVFKITLDENIEFDIINPNATKFEMLHIVITQNATGNFTITWPSSVNGTPTIDLTALSETTVSLFNMADGTWRFVTTKGGVIGGGGGATVLDDLTDVTLGTPAVSEYLRHNGTFWQDSPILLADLALSDTKVIIGNGSGVGAEQTISGDATLANTGVLTLNTVPISKGGSGQITAQAAIDALSNVSAATNEHVLTKDTATGNAIWKIGGTSGAPFDDATPIVKGSVDASKRIRFEVDGLTTATTRVITAIDANMTLVGLTNTQTLENKTHETPFIKDTDPTPTADRKIDCKDGVIGTYSASVETRAISKNSLQPIDNDGIEGAANIDKSKISSTGTWNDGDLPSTVMHTDIVQNKTVQQTFSGAGTSLVVTNQATFNGDVNLGGGNVLSDISLLGDKVIRSSNTTEIGYLVTNDSGSAGSEGTIQIPTTTTAPGTAAVADSRFGAYFGAIGIQDIGVGSPILLVRQNDGSWCGVAMTRNTLT